MARLTGPRRRLRPRRFLNKSFIGALVLAFAVAGMLWRTLRPYWDGPPAPPPPPIETPAVDAPVAAIEPASLIRVVDGDTIVILRRGEEHHVRLLRIDTPERGQPGFAESTAALRSLLGQGPVGIEFVRSGKEKRDRYNRLLAYVHTPDERNACLEMVRLGHSRFVVDFGRGRFGNEFEAAEEQARMSDAGLWSNGRWRGN